MAHQSFVQMALIACALAVPASAAEISGSFTGTAINSTVGMYPFEPGDTNFNGAPLAGTFDITSPGLDIINANPSNYAADLLVGRAFLTLSIGSTGPNSFGGMFSFETTYNQGFFPPGALFLSNPSSQSLSVSADDDANYQQAGVSFTALGLFGIADPLSLPLGPIALDPALNSIPIAFAERFQFGTGIDVTSVTFNTAVAEPSSLSLCALALMALAGAKWRRRPGQCG